MGSWSIRLTALLLALVAVPTARAQVYSGSLTGLVTDPSGAVIPNAPAVLTDEDKGFTFKATTGSDGRYVLRNLAPGKYRLSITAPGMRPYKSGEIILDVGQNAQEDVHFELQGSVETVSVAGSA